MFDPRRLDDTISVAPQIAPDDLPAVEAAGFVAVINNRPDGEEPGQPGGAAIRAAAEAAGLAYHAIPVGGGMTAQQLAATAAVLAGAGGPVLAYCRSGTRSCHLWALSAAQGGAEPAAIAAKAAAAGYDLTGLQALLDHLFASPR
ncbi:MAG: TIGR01244 family sulfur transferase [Pseudomonadota bacterium]